MPLLQDLCQIPSGFLLAAFCVCPQSTFSVRPPSPPLLFFSSLHVVPSHRQGIFKLFAQTLWWQGILCVCAALCLQCGDSAGPPEGTLRKHLLASGREIRQASVIPGSPSTNRLSCCGGSCRRTTDSPLPNTDSGTEVEGSSAYSCCELL